MIKVIRNLVYSNVPPKNPYDLWVLLQEDGRYIIKMFTIDKDNIEKWVVIGGGDFTITGDWGDDEKKVINQKVVTEQFQNVDNKFEDIYDIIDPIKITFTSTPSIIDYTGGFKKVILKWSSKRESGNEGKDIPVKVSLYKKNEETGGNLFLKEWSNLDEENYTYEENFLGTTLYNLILEYKNGNVKNASTTYLQIFPIYVGISPEGNELEGISELDDRLNNNNDYRLIASHTYNNTLTIIKPEKDNCYLFIDVPEGKSVSASSSGFNVPLTTFTNTRTISGKSKKYTTYRTPNTISVEEMIIILTIQ